MLVTLKGKGLLPMSDLWFVRNDFINSLRKMVAFWACWWRRERCLFVLLWVWDNGKSLSPHEDSNQRPWDHQSAESEDLRFDSLRWLKIFFLCSKLMRRQRNIFFPVIMLFIIILMKERLPPYADHDWVKEIFSKYGKVVYIR